MTKTADTIPSTILQGIPLPPEVEPLTDQGMWAWTASNGWRVLALHHSADPDKRPGTPEGDAWIAQARKAMPSPRDWKREYDLSFEHQSGQPFFPSFSRDIHVKPCAFDPTLPLLRGWDWGRSHPACVFAQLHRDNVLRVLWSIMGTNITIFEWVPLILSHTNARFPGATLIQDYGDFAGGQETDKGATTAILLQQFGINVMCRYSYVEEGLRIVEQRLMVREDGQPGIILDPSNKDLIDGFLGGYELDSQALSSTGTVKLRNTPKKDGYYDHLMDALRYICIHVFSIIPATQQKPYIPRVHLFEQVPPLRQPKPALSQWSEEFCAGDTTVAESYL